MNKRKITVNILDLNICPKHGVEIEKVSTQEVEVYESTDSSTSVGYTSWYADNWDETFLN